MGSDAMSEAVNILRYVKLLKNQVNRIPDELFDLLNLKSSDYSVDFIRLLYINQNFHKKDSPRTSDPQPIFEIMSTHRNIAILGGAGAGKTTTLKFIANELCDQLEQELSGENSHLICSAAEIENSRGVLNSLQSNLALI